MKKFICILAAGFLLINGEWKNLQEMKESVQSYK